MADAYEMIDDAYVVVESVTAFKDFATGINILRTAEFSKNHIKFIKMVRKKSSPFLKRSRAKEFGKNT